MARVKDKFKRGVEKTFVLKRVNNNDGPPKIKQKKNEGCQFGISGAPVSDDGMADGITGRDTASVKEMVK